jgi:alpha-L-rhamnosidase
MKIFRGVVFLGVALWTLTLGRAPADAQWIWSPEDGLPDTWLCLRATVPLDKLPPKIPVRIAADSTYWLWINDRLVVNAGELKRGPTPNDTYADEIDLAPFLKPGNNTIAALVWFWGQDGSSHNNSGRGGFLLESSLPGLNTNKDWRIHPDPAFKHGKQRPPLGVRPESPVIFDARSDFPGWQQENYDDSAWEHATEKGAPPAPPWGQLVPRPIPFFRTSDPRDYVNASELSLPREGPAQLISRLPANLQVYPRLQVSAKAGCEITIQPEHSYETAKYTTREGEQTFEVPAWGNGEFVTYNIPAGVRVLKLDYRETGYDADFAGKFACSDPSLETLWKKCARSAYVNLRDSYMDCPDRERSPWPGDMTNTSSAVACVLDPRADAITAKALREFLNWQAPNGVLWGAVPSGRFRDHYRELPTQSLALIASGFPGYLEQTDDRALAIEAVPKIRRYLLECWPMDADGLPVPRPATPSWGAGTNDWMDWGNQIDRRLFETAWYAWALNGLETITRIAGLPADSAVTERRHSIAAAFDRIFWDESVHAYRSKGFPDAPDDRGNGLAVCAGLVPKERGADLVRLLSQREAATIYTERYVVDALFILGDPGAALARLKRRYATAIASPHTTLPEMFDDTGLKTNHGWGSWPAATMVRYVAGVHPVQPGYTDFAVAPSPDGLANFDLQLPSIHGDIGVQWKRTSSSATLDVKCPPGTSAQVIVPPVQQWSALTCNGIVAWPQPAANCPAKILSENPPCFRVPEGHWLFEAH